MKPTLLIATTVLRLSSWLPAARQSMAPATSQPWPPELIDPAAALHSLNLGDFQPPAQPAGSAALPPINAIVPVSQLGGSTQAVAVQGALAYISDGPRMLVLDIAVS